MWCAERCGIPPLTKSAEGVEQVRQEAERGPAAYTAEMLHC